MRGACYVDRVMPTPEEWAIIGLVLVIVLLASRLGDIGDAIGRLVHRGQGD